MGWVIGSPARWDRSGRLRTRTERWSLSHSETQRPHHPHTRERLTWPQPCKQNAESRMGTQGFGQNPSLSLSLCVSLCPSVSWSPSESICLSVSISWFRSVSLSLCIYLCFCLCLCHSVSHCVLVSVSLSLSVPVPVALSHCPSVSLCPLVCLPLLAHTHSGTQTYAHAFRLSRNALENCRTGE